MNDCDENSMQILKGDLIQRCKFFIYFLAFIAMGFSTELYTSCTKDKCTGVTCSGNGTCSAGVCTCYPDWTGSNCDQQQTTLIYRNNTYTPAYVKVAHNIYIIATGTSVSLHGLAGQHISGTAWTSGPNIGGIVHGSTVTWELSNDKYPSSGSYTHELNVPASYYLLKIRNLSSYSIDSIAVNYTQPLLQMESISLPIATSFNDVGYYPVRDTNNLHLTSVMGHFWDSALYLPNTLNQVYAFTAY